MFSKIKKMNSHHQVMFAVIIGLAVVAFWRGAWGIMDVYIFPNDYKLSSWTTLIIGFIVLVITHYTTKELM